MASILAFIAVFLVFPFSLSEGQSPVPAVYVLGDSLVDVGNNNYIEGSLLKANYPYNGIDYPGGKSTGRFCNGKNSADFLGEKLGMPTSPPYLSNTSDLFLKAGVSFASAGCGLFNSTGQGFLMKTLSLPTQVDYFTTLHGRMVQSMGAAAVQQHLSKSLFIVVIGSNDVFGYFNDGGHKKVKKVAPDVYADQMISVLQGLLKDVYSLGARKFVVVGLGCLGCTPAQRFKSSTEDCNADMNNMALSYNKKLTTMLAGLQSSFNDINYTYFDTYSALYDIIQNAAKYGFKETKAACCGLGKLNAGVFCTPLAIFCPNRSDHIFWDKVHPTQAADKILINTLYSGSHPQVTPQNVQQLIAL